MKKQNIGLIKIVGEHYKFPKEIRCSFCGKPLHYDINQKIYEHKLNDGCIKFVELHDFVRTQIENA